MATNSVLPPFPIFPGSDGQPLENGFIYIGVAGFEARTTPKASYFDTAMAIPTGTASGAAIRTMGGFPVRNGSPAMFYVDGDFSITVTDRNGVVVYSALNTTLALNVGGEIGPVLGPDGSLGAVGIGFENEPNTGFVRSAAGTMQTAIAGVLVSQQTVDGTVFQQPVSGAGFTSGVLTVAQPIGATLTSLEGLSLVAGDTIYATAADTLARLAKGTAGQSFTMNAGATAPEWAQIPAAFASFNANSVSGTYTRTGTLVTLTETAHGFTSGQYALIDFTTGTATDGWYLVTVLDANTYTVTDVASGATSGNHTRRIRLRRGRNIASIARTGTGDYTITFSTAMPDAFFTTLVSAGEATASASASARVAWNYATTTTTTSVAVSDNNSDSNTDSAFVNVVVFS